jgi:large subunit ribosomal protein L30e
VHASPRPLVRQTSRVIDQGQSSEAFVLKSYLGWSFFRVRADPELVLLELGICLFVLELLRIRISTIFVLIMSAVRKTKSVSEAINARLALVMKSGRYHLGYKSTLKSMRQGKCKLIIIASNCPPLRKSTLEYYAILAKAQVHHYPASSIELGTACGRYFRVTTMGITDPGDSDILKAIAEEAAA